MSFISNLLANDCNLSTDSFYSGLKYNDICDRLVSFLTVISYLHQCDDLRIDVLSVNARTLKCIRHLLKRTQTSNSSNKFMFQRINNELNRRKY